MISFLLFAIAAFFNAVMDTLDEGHFQTSIFSGMDPTFWYKKQSWDKAKRVFGWKLDGWHIAKSLMIIFIALTVVCYYDHRVFNFWLDFITLGAIWNGSFNLCYNHLLKRRKK
jgi:hypothetical protein